MAVSDKIVKDTFFQTRVDIVRVQDVIGERDELLPQCKVLGINSPTVVLNQPPLICSVSLLPGCSPPPARVRLPSRKASVTPLGVVEVAVSNSVSPKAKDPAEAKYQRTFPLAVQTAGAERQPR